MPALPSSLIEPIWDQFAVLIPERVVTHPWGCHRPRIPDRVVFDKLIQVLVFSDRLRPSQRRHVLGHHDPRPPR